MKTIKYQIQFYTYWHTGSGLSGGVDMNLTVIKNEYGLPLIPGKTLKGLLRDAATNLKDLDSSVVSQEFIDTVFGIEENREKENREKPYQQGQCFFSNATLSKYLTTHLSSSDGEEKKGLLFISMASTAIDCNGIARDQTLRQMEITIPLTLYATIESFPEDQKMIEQLNFCFQWIKKMGTNRTRGLGRCEFSQIKPD